MPESPTSALRFVKRKYKLPAGSMVVRNGVWSQSSVELVLQQEWRIVKCGRPAVVRTEWRDVPIVEEEDDTTK